MNSLSFGPFYPLAFWFVFHVHRRALHQRLNVNFLPIWLDNICFHWQLPSVKYSFGSQHPHKSVASTRCYVAVTQYPLQPENHDISVFEVTTLSLVSEMSSAVTMVRI